MSCALWLQSRGHRVTLVDGNEPGSVTSSGNACTLSDYGCIPVNSPDLIRRLPALVFGKDSPLSIDPWYALTHLPWMLSFLRYCRTREVEKSIDALASLLRLVDTGLDPLVSLTGTGDLMRKKGCMYVYRSERDFENSREKNHARARHGAELTELSRDEIYDLEPNLNRIFERGVYFPNSGQVRNPKTLVDRWFRYFRDRGGAYTAEHARGMIRGGNGPEIILHDGSKLSVDAAIICAGAFSREIEGCGTEELPLGIERGYHVQYAGLEELVSRPVAWIDLGFYAVPTSVGLRFAGTVEIGGLSEKKNPKRIAFIENRSREMFDLKGASPSTWLGFRPTMPDSLPVIGPSARFPGTYYAFGHQHIGLTLAGITGKLVSELVAGEIPCVDIAPFSAERFRPA